MELFWDGAINKKQFTESVKEAIGQEYMDAWLEAAQANGRDIGEITPEEFKKLDDLIAEQNKFVGPLADSIAEKLSQGKTLESVAFRASFWGNSYSMVYQRGITVFGGDKKKKWIIGKTEESCPSCTFFEGRVYLASTWEENGVHPKMHGLACHGVHCDCELVDTDEPITPGRFPTNWP